MTKIDLMEQYDNSSKKSKPWQVQKKLEKEKIIPSTDDLYNMIKKIKDARNKALAAMLYLVCSRASEITNYNKKKYRTTQAPHPKKKDEKITVYHWGKYKRNKKEETLKKKHIKIKYMNGKRIMEVTTPLRKNKQQHTKVVPIPIDKEKKLISLIRPYIKKLKHDETLFPISSKSAYKIIKKELGFGCHWLRHCRLTNLKIEHGLGPDERQLWAGWSDKRPDVKYTHLDTERMLY